MGQVLSAHFPPPPEDLRVEAIISRGKYAEVSSGSLEGRRVTVKKFSEVLSSSVADKDGGDVEALGLAFKTEYEFLKANINPYMIEYLGLFSSEGSQDAALLVMEEMHQTLEVYLEQNRLLPRPKKLDICYQVSCGLLFLHKRDPPILHCDLNPRNIFVSEDGSSVKIGDLSRAQYHPSNIKYLSTRSPGCLVYMPPEYLGKDVNFTDKGDTFSLGVVMLEVFTQEPPSCGLMNIGAEPETERRAVDLAALSNFHPLKPLIVRCLDDAPDSRPCAKEIRDRLMFLIHNPLRVEEVISRGSYGEVFKGTLGARPVAIKKIHQILLDAAADQEQDLEAILLAFRRECEVLKRAKDPHIVEFFGVYDKEWEEDGEYLVMELMHQTLDKFLKDNKGTLPVEKQVDICYQVSCGLLFLHQQDPQILHRDVTALNILLNEDGSTAKISDLGQAKFRPSNVQYLSTRAPGCVIYMPPECLKEEPQFTDRSDTFSFGTVMLQVSSQEPPSCGLMGIGTTSERERRAGDLAKVPDDHPLKPLIVRCLDDNPANRPDMQEVQRYFGHLKLKAELSKDQKIFGSDVLLQTNTPLHSIRLPDLPIATYSATLLKIANHLYVCGGTYANVKSAPLIQSYDIDTGEWTTLPPAPVFHSESAVVNGQLTLIGGHGSMGSKWGVTNHVFTWDEDEKEWDMVVPPMPTERIRPCVVQSGDVVAVFGGRASDDKTPLDTVDVLNTATLQWSGSPSLTLPIPMSAMTAGICDGYVYITSGLDHRGHITKRVWKLPLTALEESISVSDCPSESQWIEIEQVPLSRCGLLPASDHPLVLGGYSNSKTFSDIHVFDANVSKWTSVGQCSQVSAKSCLLTASRSSFAVLGGCTDLRNAQASLLNTFELYYC